MSVNCSYSDSDSFYSGSDSDTRNRSFEVKKGLSTAGDDKVLIREYPHGVCDDGFCDNSKSEISESQIQTLTLSLTLTLTPTLT